MIRECLICGCFFDDSARKVFGARTLRCDRCCDVLFGVDSQGNTVKVERELKTMPIKTENDDLCDRIAELETEVADYIEAASDSWKIALDFAKGWRRLRQENEFLIQFLKEIAFSKIDGHDYDLDRWCAGCGSVKCFKLVCGAGHGRSSFTDAQGRARQILKIMGEDLVDSD